MDASQEKAYQKLSANLDDLVKNYRSLLDLIRKEKDLLIAADIEKLIESNKSKEALLYRLKGLDSGRERYAEELAYQINADTKSPRLLELAQKIGGTAGDKLRNIHSTLDILIKRLTELNKENEEYAQSALQNLNGAVGNIKDTLSGKKTYEKKGKMAYGPEKAGNFVSKEA